MWDFRHNYADLPGLFSHEGPNICVVSKNEVSDNFSASPSFVNKENLHDFLLSIVCVTAVNVQ